MKRIILHIDLDAFFAQTEERENPHFRGKPLVVGADPKKGRGVVSTANYKAREFGIRSGMPISQAWKKCPEAVFLPVNMNLYSEASRKVMEIVGSYSSKKEKVSVDEMYLDLSCLKSFKKAEALGKKIKKEIFLKEKLTSTIGIGPNKLVAKIACSQAKPDGLKVVTPSEAKGFLAPLLIKEIPGIGPKTKEKLKVKTIKELRRFSQKELKNLLGKNGNSIYEKARGIDPSPVEGGREAKSVGKEHTFLKDTRNPEIIFKKFNQIVSSLTNELSQRDISFKGITVVCRFSGFETHTKSKILKEGDYEKIGKEARKLLLRFIIENPKPIRLIGLRIKII